MPGFAVFRADAGLALGTGHVIRCLSLAHALARLGWRCAFAVSAQTPATVPRLSASGFEVRVLTEHDEPGALARAWPGGCDLLVADHYERDHDFESKCRPWCRRIAAIDDLPGRRHAAEVVIDPGAGGMAAEGTGLHLAGPGFALLDAAFAIRRRAAPGRRHDAVSRIFAAFGGGNTVSITRDAVAAVARSQPDAAMDVVVGAASPGTTALAESFRAIRSGIRLHEGLMPTAIADMMAEADIGIGAAGTMTWERCCLGLASVVVVIVDNQRGNARRIAEAGAGIVVDGMKADAVATIVEAARSLASDDGGRALAGRKAAALCDGMGAGRAAAIIDAAPHARDGTPIWFRPACSADIDRVLAWQHEPGARQYARNPTPPDPASHRTWMQNRLCDPGCLFSIIMLGNMPAGFVRLDRASPITRALDSFELSILIAKAVRGQGIGAAALALTRRLVPEAEIQAVVLPGNDGSHALFRKAGYRDHGAGHYLSRPLAPQASVA